MLGCQPVGEGAISSDTVLGVALRRHDVRVRRPSLVTVVLIATATAGTGNLATSTVPGATALVAIRDVGACRPARRRRSPRRGSYAAQRTRRGWRTGPHVELAGGAGPRAVGARSCAASSVSPNAVASVLELYTPAGSRWPRLGAGRPDGGRLGVAARARTCRGDRAGFPQVASRTTGGAGRARRGQERPSCTAHAGTAPAS
jgi:hypothetical protein